MTEIYVNLKTGEVREGKQANPNYFAQNLIGVEWFKQTTKPTHTDPNYLKVENGIVVDKTAGEIAYFEACQEFERIKRTEFLGFRYRVHCPWPYIVETYPDIATWCLAKKSIETDIDSVTLVSKTYFNDRFAGFDMILQSDSNFTIFDSENLRPNADYYH